MNKKSNFLIVFFLIVLVTFFGYAEAYPVFLSLEFNHPFITLILLGTLVVLIVTTFASKNSAHFNIIVFVFLGAVSTLSTWHTFIIFSDNSQRQEIIANVTEKLIVRHRGGISHALKLKNYQSNEDPAYINVSTKFFQSVNKNDDIAYTVKDGVLGYKWIESYEKLPLY